MDGKQLISRMVLYGLPGVVIGVIVAFALNVRKEAGLAPRTDRLEQDANHDGKADAVFYYSGDLLLRAEYDRNFDGVFDFWYWYSQGIVARAEADDNFDGTVDAWDTYLHGNPVARKADTDWNGIPDESHEYEHGVLAKSSWHPNGAKISRVEFFKHAVKIREEVDADGDGAFETQKYYDAFGNELADGPRTR